MCHPSYYNIHIMIWNWHSNVEVGICVVVLAWQESPLLSPLMNLSNKKHMGPEWIEPAAISIRIFGSDNKMIWLGPSHSSAGPTHVLELTTRWVSTLKSKAAEIPHIAKLTKSIGLYGCMGFGDLWLLSIFITRVCFFHFHLVKKNDMLVTT